MMKVLSIGQEYYIKVMYKPDRHHPKVYDVNILMRLAWKEEKFS